MFKRIKYRLKARFVHWLTRNLFVSVDSNDILQQDNTGQYWFMNTPISADQIKRLGQQSERILNTEMWEVVKQEIQWQATRQMYFKSQTEDDLLAGKTYLYVLDQIEKTLKKIEKQK